MTDSKIEINKDKKTEFSEWYTQIIIQTKLLDYYPISGCYIMLPFSYKMWEIIQSYVDNKLKKINVDNVYFPLLIPSTYLNKESSHIEGFTPEVVWVSKTGNDDENVSDDTNDKNKVRLCIRPTSETAIYPTFSKEIRSHSDVPLCWNQWCNVMRWEFTSATPFIRSREFLWQEMHGAFENTDQMYKNIKDMLKIYKETYEKLLSVPVIVGKKIDSEKFAGADETFSIETFIPESNKFIQCATAHNLGINFAKIFDIKYLTTSGSTEFCIQTSAGLTTRSIGTSIMMHSDNTGLILSPKFAPIQIIIIPITYTKDQEVSEKIYKLASDLNNYLMNHFRVKLDNTKVRPGWKFYNWEAKGVPLRIEIGAKDIQNSVITICDRVTKNKSQISMSDFTELTHTINNMFSLMELNLLNMSKNKLDPIIVNDKNQIIESFKFNKPILINLCNNLNCDKFIRETYQMKPICRPINCDTLETLKLVNYENCIICNETGQSCYIGKTF